MAPDYCRIMDAGGRMVKVVTQIGQLLARILQKIVVCQLTIILEEKHLNMLNINHITSNVAH